MSDEKKQQELNGLKGALAGCKTSIEIVSASPIEAGEEKKVHAYQWLKHIESLLLKSIAEVEKSLQPEPAPAA